MCEHMSMVTVDCSTQNLKSSIRQHLYKKLESRVEVNKQQYRAKEQVNNYNNNILQKKTEEFINTLIY